MSLEFRYAHRDEYPRIRHFIDEYWAKDHVYVRDPALFCWTFHRPGFWNPEQFSFALGEDNGDLIGILGGIPFSFNEFGKKQSGVWIANFTIRPDHRRGTAALKLLSMFRTPEHAVVVASGLNPDTVAIYKVLRGRVLPEMPRHFAILPGLRCRASEMIAAANPSLSGSEAEGLASFFELRSLLPDSADYQTSIPEDWDENTWNATAQQTVGAARDLDYLRWRYLNHPRFTYRVISLNEGLKTGLLIWRLETIRQQTDSGRVDLDRIGRIVEFLPASRENGRHLLGGLLCQLKSEDAIGADFYGYHGWTRSVLAESGFHSVDMDPRGAMIPSRFQPLAPGGTILNAMFSSPALAECTTATDCPWYWTKSDSDQDRPN